MLIIKLLLYKFYKIEFITHVIIQFPSFLALGQEKSVAAAAAAVAAAAAAAARALVYINSEYLMTLLY